MRPVRVSVGTGAFVASLLLHAGLVLAVGPEWVGRPVKPRLARLEAAVERAIVLDEEVALLPAQDLPESRPMTEGAMPELADERPAEAVDPRSTAVEAGGEWSDGDAGLVGIGAGRILPRLRRRAVAEVAAPGPIEAAAPPGPSIAATLLPDGRREPDYPARERRLGIEGVVLLLARIDPRGAVDGVEVLESSGAPALDRAAADAVLEWRFSPALRDGVPVEDSLRLRIRFSLVDPGRAAAGR